jgi:LAGLIDADG endonuclease
MQVFPEAKVQREAVPYFMHRIELGSSPYTSSMKKEMEGLVTTKNKKGGWNKNFLEWLVGFTEGDGSFLIDIKRGRLFFVITQRDPKLLYAVRKGLGFGSVNSPPSADGVWKFSVSNQKGIDKLIHLFNGKLLLRKVSARFSLWLQARNSLWGKENHIEKKEDPSPTPLLIQSTGWLSGFTEAEGCFSISKCNDGRYTNGFRVRFRYILDQKEELEVLEAIRAFLESGDLRERKEGIWRLTVTHRKSCFRVIDYFKKYPLRGKKSINLLRWAKTLRLVEDGFESEKRRKKLTRLIEKTSPIKISVKGELKIESSLK